MYVDEWCWSFGVLTYDSVSSKVQPGFHQAATKSYRTRAEKIHWSQKKTQVLPDVVRLGESTALFLGQWHFLPSQAFFTGAMQASWLLKKAGAELENCETFQLIDLETLQLAKYTEVKFKTSPSNLHLP